MTEISDLDRCIFAIHDYGTRPGATPSKLIKSLKSDGFTAGTIKKAVVAMGGGAAK